MTNEQKEMMKCLADRKEMDLIEVIRIFKREGIKNFAIVRKEYLDTVLSLIKQKDKQIDLMADFMYKTGTGRRTLSCMFRQNDECNENGCIYCIKQYFSGLIEKE